VILVAGTDGNAIGFPHWLAPCEGQSVEFGGLGAAMHNRHHMHVNNDTGGVVVDSCRYIKEQQKPEEYKKDDLPYKKDDSTYKKDDSTYKKVDNKPKDSTTNYPEEQEETEEYKEPK
jgi:hypothetical protein